MINISQIDEEYKQYAGLSFRRNLIERLAEMKISNSNIFLEFFSYPRSIVLGAIESIALSKTKGLELELYTTRDNKVSSSKYKIGDSAVNWSTWRQFNSHEKDHAIRKQVFDEFIQKSKSISSIVENRFLLIKKIYEEYGNNIDENKINKLDPVSAYLENENITYERLTEIIKSMGNKAKKPFREALYEVSKKILDKEPEYYDDFYFFRNRIYSDLDRNFTTINPLSEVKRILTDMEFDLNNIHFDVEDRENKYPSPICFPVMIPNDVRILYKRESPYFDFQACFHETGHAMHYSSVDVNNKYWDKYWIPMGIAEIFSMVLENVTKDSNYIKPLLGLGKDNIYHELTCRNNFMYLFLITFYAANSLMKLQYWKENLSIEQACKIYSELIKEYTGFEIPGEYWLLHHILPENIMYVPSYLLAAVRATELKKYLKNRFGDKWWEEKETGRTLREIMSPGGNIDLSIFSKLDINILFEELTNY